MITVRFAYSKATKNFDVYREVDSKGVPFPEDYNLLKTHPELHKVGSIYLRKNSFPLDSPATAIQIVITSL